MPPGLSEAFRGIKSMCTTKKNKKREEYVYYVLGSTPSTLRVLGAHLILTTTSRCDNSPFTDEETEAFGRVKMRTSSRSYS